MGGGARYPYPKEVWSPAGGWWTRPSNWKANTAILFAGILGVSYGVWTVSADKEYRYNEPIRAIPSIGPSSTGIHKEQRRTINHRPLFPYFGSCFGISNTSEFVSIALEHLAISCLTYLFLAYLPKAYSLSHGPSALSKEIREHQQLHRKPFKHIYWSGHLNTWRQRPACEKTRSYLKGANVGQCASYA
ncbi:hypothetical protein B0F90DRAFT_1184247 [Multifurca ochricompacta]|uniref:Uncharacterized protein n=1 Tax=Multifurca ochricompacta TaxID=376703 RepID=A0AAD4M7K8_9AGAM|nr:hypothetical protein B0F90DRAFT_1184247 [Multifurca ochricompacta]